MQVSIWNVEQKTTGTLQGGVNSLRPVGYVSTIVMSREGFEIECESAVTRLKSALIDLFDAGEADPQRPQDVARRFGINKTLTWSISRFLDSPSTLEAVSFVPGASTLQRVAEAFPKSRRVTAAKVRVHEAAVAFDDVIARHAGDRATLELILDGLADDHDRQLEVSRRLAFRGNSGLCGVQARTRLGLWMIAPSQASGDRLDLVTIRGYTRVRRLRANVEWPILRTRGWTPNTDVAPVPSREPLDPRATASLPMLPDWCRGALPRLEEVPTREGTDYMVRSGPVGNIGAFDCFAGDLLRANVTRYAAEDDERGELGSIITTPSERLIFDILYHRDLPNVEQAQVVVLREAMPGGVPTPEMDDPRVLPIRPRLVALPGTPPAVATPLVPRYSEMVQFGMSRAGWKSDEFKALRMEMAYPPLNSQITIRFPLPTR